MIATQAITFKISAKTTAVDARYMGPSITIVLEYRIVNTRDEVCSTRIPKQIYFKGMATAVPTVGKK